MFNNFAGKICRKNQNTYFMYNFAGKICRGNQNTNFMFNNFA